MSSRLTLHVETLRALGAEDQRLVLGGTGLTGGCSQGTDTNCDTTSLDRSVTRRVSSAYDPC